MARLPTSSLIAAGTQLRVASYDEATRLQLSRQHWTERAWSYYENVGEVRYAANFLANSLGRLRLVAAKTPPISEDPYADPVEVPDGPVAEAVSRLRDPRGGQRALLRALGLNLFITGETFLLGTTVNETEVWEVLSSSEIDVRTGYNQFFRRPLPNVAPEPLPDSALVIRVWKEHPRWSMLADSAMRTVLDQCETLLLLTRMERAAARSRFAGSGILFVPNELLPSGSRGESDSAFYQNLMESMIAPIKDETHPSSVVPILLTGAAEYGKAIQHITMERDLDGASLVALKDDAVKRLAAAFDMPSEVLTGNQDLNHWGMAVVREETFAAHIQPFAEMVVDSLTVAYLHPALQRAGVKDWQDYHVWFDASKLIQKADKLESAVQLHDRFAISDETLRHSGGFSDSDAPDKDEYAKRIGIKMVNPKMAVTGELPPDPPAAPPAGGPQPAPSGGEAGTGGSGRGRNLETVEPDYKAPGGARSGAKPTKESRRVSSSTTAPKSVSAAGGQQDLGLGVKLGSLDVMLLGRVQSLMEMAIHRTAEKAGAKVRSKALGNDVIRASLNGVNNRDVIPTLGPAMVASLGYKEMDLVDAAVADLGLELGDVLADGYDEVWNLIDFYLARRAAREGLVSTAEALNSVVEANILDAKSNASDVLKRLAYDYLFGEREPGTPPGEVSRLFVRPGDVREIIIKAGGGTPVPGTIMGGVGTGKTVVEALGQIGVEVDLNQRIWLYGQVARKEGFQGHMQLDGGVFLGDTDPLLEVWPEHGWLRRSYYAPGDHKGCACIVAPYVPNEGPEYEYRPTS